MNAELARILHEEIMVPQHHLHLDTRLDSLDLDSLAIVELALLLRERLALDITESDIKRAVTLGDLDRRIQQTLTGN